ARADALLGATPALSTAEWAAGDTPQHGTCCVGSVLCDANGLRKKCTQHAHNPAVKGGRVERTPPVCRCALYSPLLPPFGPGSVTVFHPAPLCASPSQKPACGFPAQASSAGH